MIKYLASFKKLSAVQSVAEPQRKTVIQSLVLGGTVVWNVVILLSGKESIVSVLRTLLAFTP